MSKTALGRGLGDLLKGTQVQAKPPAPAEAEAAGPTPVTPALGRLLTARPPATAKPWQRPIQEPVRNGDAVAPKPNTIVQRLPVLAPGTRLTLFAADAMILLLCATLVYRERGTMGVLEAILCVAGVLVAATAGALALRSGKEQ